MLYIIKPHTVNIFFLFFFLFVVRTLKIYALSKCQVYSTVLLTTVTCCILDITHLPFCVCLISLCKMSSIISNLQKICKKTFCILLIRLISCLYLIFIPFALSHSPYTVKHTYFSTSVCIS